MQEIALGIPTQQNELNLPRADDIRIGDEGPVMRSGDGAVELVSMRFGFPPAKPKAAPVFNFRSEGRSFANSKRCMVPASAFFEFTGSKYPKTKHRFTLNGASFMAIAGLWREGERAMRVGKSFDHAETEPDGEPSILSVPALSRPRFWQRRQN